MVDREREWERNQERDYAHEVTRLRIQIDALGAKVDGVAAQLAADLRLRQEREQRQQEREERQAERVHAIRLKQAESGHSLRMKFLTIVVPIITAIGGVLAGVMGSR